jgi:hypothetical protein
MKMIVFLLSCGLALSTSDAPKVKVLQFVMAQCPMTSTLHATFAKQVMNNTELRAIVDFEQTFVGGPVGEGPVNETNWMYCFHGKAECETHTMMLCARNKTQDYSKWYDMISCIDGPDGLKVLTSAPRDAIPCARTLGISKDEIQEIQDCAAGKLGQQLLHDSHFHTMDLFAKHGGYAPEGHGYRPPKIPNVWIYDKNGVAQEYNDPLKPAKDPYAHLVQKICDAYTGTKPSICASA